MGRKLLFAEDGQLKDGQAATATGIAAQFCQARHVAAGEVCPGGLISQPASACHRQVGQGLQVSFKQLQPVLPHLLAIRQQVLNARPIAGGVGDQW